MLQLLAAIPGIISAIGKVTDLFNKGKETVKDVSGNIAQASTPEELATEITKLPLDQQNRWAEIMSKEVEKYAAQNERLAIEIGLVDKSSVEKISTEAADKVALLRMTTRPWAVRWMVYYVLFPFFLVVADVIQNILLHWLPFLKTRLGIEAYGTFKHFFGVLELPAAMDTSVIEKFAAFFSSQAGPTTFAGQLYLQSVPWVVSVILAYMGLREVGKWKGYNNVEQASAVLGPPAPSTMAGKVLQQGMDLIPKIRQWFKK
ncbi:hypothetical protein K8S19_09280 [bacterium]|nr:hypothetical protein [bacterium]